MKHIKIFTSFCSSFDNKENIKVFILLIKYKKPAPACLKYWHEQRRLHSSV